MVLWYDVVFAIFLTLYMFMGYLVGFLKPVAGIIGLCLSLWAATKYYTMGAVAVINVYLEVNHDIAKVLGFILVWLVVTIVYGIIATLVINILTKNETIADWNRWLGLALNLFKGTVIISLIFWLVDTYTPKPWFQAKETMQKNSFMYKIMKPAIPLVGTNLVKLTSFNWSQPLNISTELQKKIDDRKKLLKLDEAVQKKIDEMIKGVE